MQPEFIDAKSPETGCLEERELSAGLTFSAVCGKYPSNFADLTTPGKKCIDPKLMAGVRKKVNACVGNQLKVWKERLDGGLITEEIWKKLIDLVTTTLCY